MAAGSRNNLCGAYALPCKAKFLRSPLALLTGVLVWPKAKPLEASLAGSNEWPKAIRLDGPSENLYFVLQSNIFVRGIAFFAKMYAKPIEYAVFCGNIMRNFAHERLTAGRKLPAFCRYVYSFRKVSLSVSIKAVKSTDPASGRLGIRADPLREIRRKVFRMYK